MKKSPPPEQSSAPIASGNGELLVYQTEDGRVKLDVRLENETVWLTQQLLAELFQTSKQNISHHIQGIFEEGELSPEATVKKCLTVQREGSRDVQRNLEFYNLDMIISVGYRIKSQIARHPLSHLGHPAAEGVPGQGLYHG